MLTQKEFMDMLAMRRQGLSRRFGRDLPGADRSKRHERRFGPGERIHERRCIRQIDSANLDVVVIAIRSLGLSLVPNKGQYALTFFQEPGHDGDADLAGRTYSYDCHNASLSGLGGAISLNQVGSIALQISI
jgi:hypothetical protein